MYLHPFPRQVASRLARLLVPCAVFACLFLLLAFARAQAQDRTPMGVEPSTQLVEVALAGAGSGEVSSVPSGIDCGNTCSAHFAVGLPITLTASAGVGSGFAGWGGDCSGSTLTCVVTVSAPLSVTATFVPIHILTLTEQPPGLGTLIANPPGPDYPHGTFVEVTAVANEGAAFVSWAGACPTPSTCTLSMTEDKEVIGIFAPLYTVTIHKAGAGTASPTTFPAGPQFVAGSEVIVFANLGTGTLLTSYSGDCTGSSSCQLTMDSNKVVTITTHLESYIVTVGVIGNGTVESSVPGNIADFGTQMIYTPHPAEGWKFLEWNGSCTGNNTPCAFELTGNSYVSATFVPSGDNRDIDAADVQLIGGTVDRTLAPVAAGTFTVTDSYEPGDTYGWSLDESSAAGNPDFTLHAQSGVLVLQNKQAALGPRSLTITVADGRGSSITKKFVVVVTEEESELQVWMPTIQQ